MTYQALYRKYRSQRFDQMVGQELVATTLKNAVMNKQISHAYLFSGPRGTGKTSAAKIFAKAINCPHQVDGEPCNECFICQSISKGNLDDVIELDAASNNGVDEIREIRDKSTYAPSLAAYKIYIIDEVHMLSTGAFNALLKTLEEPSENVVFILATTEIQKIPATILSRVQRFEFKTISSQAIKNHLEHILDLEGVSFDDSAMEVISRAANGGMRDALSILDQVLSLSDGLVSLEDSLLITGSISNEAMNSYLEALLAFDTNKALSELDTLFNQGKNMLRFTEDLLFALRDLLLKPDLDFDKNLIFSWIDIASDSMKTLKSSLQTKIIADVMTIKITSSKGLGSGDDNAGEGHVKKLEDEILALKLRLKDIEGKLSQQGAPSKPALLSREQDEDTTFAEYYDREKVFSVLKEATMEDRQATINAWDELIAHFNKPSEQALLSNTKPVAASKNYVLITFPHENLAKKIMENQLLQAQFGNHLSNIIGVAPEIIALSEGDWLNLRSDYVAQLKKNQTQDAQEQQLPDQIQPEVETEENPNNQLIEAGLKDLKNLLGEKVVEIKD
ncbi:DNA polymerase III subunit gamma/tau [Streptococcaceae bacterium ESL0729]|nr:DNA polymerase III subunit gamma/tau [Streptococcaceae bacterium ESL0729]